MIDMAISDIEAQIISCRQMRVSEEQIDVLPRCLREDTECAICLETVEDGLKELRCTHTFCKQCLWSWLRMCNACPMCRATVITDGQQIITPDAVCEGLRSLRRLVYALMCEDVREAIT